MQEESEILYTGHPRRLNASGHDVRVLTRLKSAAQVSVGVRIEDLLHSVIRANFIIAVCLCAFAARPDMARGAIRLNEDAFSLAGHVGGYDRAEILLKRISQLPGRDVSTEESKARRRVLLER